MACKQEGSSTHKEIVTPHVPHLDNPCSKPVPLSTSFPPFFHPYPLPPFSPSPRSEDLTDGRFLDVSALLLPQALRRWPGSTADGPDRPAMDLAYLLDHVMTNVRPLDLAAVINSPLPLKASANTHTHTRTHTHTHPLCV